jgi:DNA (cytosine-5)-methyltransferase 1
MGLIVDNFAGGGGASTGIEQALARAVDLAINHDEQAIRMHEVNHPGTRHVRNNIWQIDPVEATGGEPVDLAWFSPDCKHFSKAKGGKPREKSIRDLAWVVVLWGQRVKPKAIFLENVEEFRSWGPLDADGQVIRERAGETFDKWCRALRRQGYKLQFRELRACDYGAPTIRKRFFMIARSDGEPIAWPEPTHGKPDSPEVLSGKRLPWRTAAEIIDWSTPCPSIFERKKPLADKTLRRIAHGIVKFVLTNPKPFIVGCGGRRGQSPPCDIDKPYPTTTAKADACLVMPHVTKFRTGSIGDSVEDPLATVTANSFIKRPGGAAPLGIVEAKLEHADFACISCGEDNGGTWWPTCEWCGQDHTGVVAPFASYAQQGGANRSAEEPLHTVTASQKDHNTVVGAHLVHIGNGEREGQAPRAMDVEKPLGTVVAGGIKHAVAVAHMMQANGGPNNDRLAGRPVGEPLSTATTKGSQQQLVTSNLIKLRGTSKDGQPVDEPLHTVSAGGLHMGEVRAFLLKYYGTDQDPQLGDPLHSVTSKDRFGLVTVTIEGEEYVIVDIGMRMLTPRELFNAQGFPPDYIIDRDAEGLPITKTAQVAKCGNSVCPPIARALVAANFPAEVANASESEAA